MPANRAAGFPWLWAIAQLVRRDLKVRYKNSALVLLVIPQP